MDPLSADFIKLARALKGAELYSKAYEVFIVTVTRNPELADSHCVEICNLLEILNHGLAERGRMEDIFNNFEKAMRIYPHSHNLLNDIGKYLFKYGFYKEAWAHFERVLHLNLHQVMAEKNLNSVKNLLVERWHFRMLNDNLRNEAYRQAIKENVCPRGDKVIDVGTGTGLLAIYACEAGAKDIVACDGSETMTEIAQSILLENKLTNDIRIINKMSTSMDSQDLIGKATLLLMEMFDAGLFGEHVLQMLQHAWPALLSEQARVIPNSAEFFITGAQCNHLNTKYQLSTEAKKFLNLGKKKIHVLAPDETYDCEDVHLQKDIKYLTEPQSVVRVNFNDLKDIEIHLNRTEPYEVELKATEDGIINTFIGWFNLYLSDTITITTDPRSDTRANAWQQAVFFDEVPRTVMERDTFKLEFLMNGGHFKLKPSSNAKITRVSPEMIRFLNDEDYIRMITSVIPMACVYLGKIVDMSQISVADLCPFPVFGMLLMKRGASSLLCCAKNEHDKKFILQVFKKNSIPLTNVTILLGNDWTVKLLRDDKYHAVFAHYLELGGDIDTRLKDIATKLKEHHLHIGGLFMPANLWIVGQLVSSHWLDINNILYDVNVSKFSMAEIVNKYSVNMNYFVDFSTLKYVPLTNPVKICQYPEGSSIQENTTPVTKDGHANAILCSYEIELMQNLKITNTSRPNSFMDGMLFMTRSRQSLLTGDIIRLLQYRDEEGAIKLIFRKIDEE
ncbi:Arginine N-methyltransferase [Operophtera brumata]|uniref:Arginine N-methyltransferase n=1 Tax=Operophtera brumata TaxID=104452 RepID=A0A0L7LDY2_OPEBR|nr:Arginine N-methyltransferase [Operophtera brumata]